MIQNEIEKCVFYFKDGSGDWVSLDSELEMREGEVVGTKTPTGHSLLIDCRFEPPLGKFCHSPSLRQCLHANLQKKLTFSVVSLCNIWILQNQTKKQTQCKQWLAAFNHAKVEPRKLRGIMWCDLSNIHIDVFILVAHL